MDGTKLLLSSKKVKNAINELQKTIGKRKHKIVFFANKDGQVGFYFSKKNQ